jgi:hypothetical protein
MKYKYYDFFGTPYAKAMNNNSRLPAATDHGWSRERKQQPSRPKMTDRHKLRRYGYEFGKMETIRRTGTISQRDE